MLDSSADQIQSSTARFSVIDPHRMMQTCGLTDGFVRTGIIASTYGHSSVSTQPAVRHPLVKAEVIINVQPVYDSEEIHYIGEVNQDKVDELNTN